MLQQGELSAFLDRSSLTSMCQSWDLDAEIAAMHH